MNDSLRTNKTNRYWQVIARIKGRNYESRRIDSNEEGLPEKFSREELKQILLKSNPQLIAGNVDGERVVATFNILIPSHLPE
jgi:hypothetical protein